MFDRVKVERMETLIVPARAFDCGGGVQADVPEVTEVPGVHSETAEWNPRTSSVLVRSRNG